MFRAYCITLLLPCFRARNSVSFLRMTPAGIWCALKASLNSFQENQVPAGNIATWLSHHVRAGPLSCCAAYDALSLSLYGYSVNLDSMVLSQLSASNGSSAL